MYVVVPSAVDAQFPSRLDVYSFLPYLASIDSTRVEPSNGDGFRCGMAFRGISAGELFLFQKELLAPLVGSLHRRLEGEDTCLLSAGYLMLVILPQRLSSPLLLLLPLPLYLFLSLQLLPS